MNEKKTTIIYMEILDHVSHSNTWLTEEEFNQNCDIEPVQVVGILEKEDNLAFHLSTMKGMKSKEKGSGHTILKSTVYYYKKIPLKIHFNNIEAIHNAVVVQFPLIK